MGLSREEIIDLASRYITLDETVDFPFEGDVFCLLVRPASENQTVSEEEGWVFRGYGICIGYTPDEESKPHGKWLWMHFASLEAFPPLAQVLKLQPPHVVKGRFHSADRTNEVRIIKVGIGNITSTPQREPAKISDTEERTVPDSVIEKKIVQFRKKNSDKKTET